MQYKLALNIPHRAALESTFGPIFSDLDSAMQARAFLECSGKAKYPVLVVNLHTDTGV